MGLSGAQFGFLPESLDFTPGFSILKPAAKVGDFVEETITKGLDLGAKGLTKSGEFIAEKAVPFVVGTIVGTLVSGGQRVNEGLLRGTIFAVETGLRHGGKVFDFTSRGVTILGTGTRSRAAGKLAEQDPRALAGQTGGPSSRAAQITEVLEDTEPVSIISDSPAGPRGKSQIIVRDLARDVARARLGIVGARCNCSLPASKLDARCRKICGK